MAEELGLRPATRVRPDLLPEKFYVDHRLGHWSGPLIQDTPRRINVTPLLLAAAAKKNMELSSTARAEGRFHFEVMRRAAPELVVLPFLNDTWSRNILEHSQLELATEPFLTPDKPVGRVITARNKGWPLMEHESAAIGALFKDASRHTDMGVICDLRKLRRVARVSGELTASAKVKELHSAMGAAPRAPRTRRARNRPIIPNRARLPAATRLPLRRMSHQRKHVVALALVCLLAAMVAAPSAATGSAPPPKASPKASAGLLMAIGDEVPYGVGLANPGPQPRDHLPVRQPPSPKAYPSVLAKALNLTLNIRKTGCTLVGDQLAVSGAPTVKDNVTGPDSDCGSAKSHKTVDPSELVHLRKVRARVVTIQAGADDIEFSGCILHELGISLKYKIFGQSTSNCTSGTGLTDRVARRITRFRVGLNSILNTVRRKQPNATIVLLNYYQPLPSPSEFVTLDEYVHLRTAQGSETTPERVSSVGHDPGQLEPCDQAGRGAAPRRSSGQPRVRESHDRARDVHPASVPVHRRTEESLLAGHSAQSGRPSRYRGGDS